MKCPFCKSENTERISGSTALTKRIPEKVSVQNLQIECRLKRKGIYVLIADLFLKS